jgi:hypothetical protein
MSDQEQDPYKYFQNKLKGHSKESESSDEEISATSINNKEIAEDKFEDDYSMDDEADFSLSMTMGKKPDSGLSDQIAASNMLNKMSTEQKAELAKKKAEDEYKRLQAKISEDSSDSSTDQKPVKKGGK